MQLRGAQSKNTSVAVAVAFAAAVAVAVAVADTFRMGGDHESYKLYQAL